MSAQDLPDLPAGWQLRQGPLPPGPVPDLAPLPGDASGAAHPHWLVLEGPGPDGQAAPQALAALRLRPQVGLRAPRYWYHVGCVVHASQALQLYHRQTRLLLGSDLTSATELAAVRWNPAALDPSGPGPVQALRLLLRAALLQVAAERERHGGTLMAELPGLRGPDGASPFWQGLGRPFFDGDLAELARRHGPRWRSLVARLLPRQPVYASFLDAQARGAIGQAHPAAQPWQQALLAEGLAPGQHITIDDGGPVLCAAIDRLAAVQQVRHCLLQPLAQGTGAEVADWLVMGPDGPRRVRAMLEDAAPGRPRGQVLRVAGAWPAGLAEGVAHGCLPAQGGQSG